MGQEATLNLVAIQQKQLLQLEAEVVERQRALQENLLRLKLMTTPMLQAWAEVTSEATGVASAGGPLPHVLGRFYMRLFQNKKLVCWTDSSEAVRNSSPAKVCPPPTALRPSPPCRPSKPSIAFHTSVPTHLCAVSAAY